MNEPVVYMLQDEDDVEFNTMDMFSCGRTGGIPLYLHQDPRVPELEAVLRECRNRLAFIDRLDDDRDFLYESEWKQLHETIAKIDKVLK